jgi:regulator of sigma E protease
VISGLLAGSPAEKAGLKAGDYLMSANDHTISSFTMLRQEIQKSGEQRQPAKVVVLREGKPQTFKLDPAQNESKDPLGRSVKSYAIGVYPLLASSEPDMVVERIYNPFRLVVESWSRALDLSVKTLVSIKKLASRQVSMATLGGPLLIGKLAGDSFSRGITAFLKAMALISISLAVFNILPIPVLDGGHIMLLLIEKLRGRPLGLKQTENIQQLGLSLIMLLLVVVLFNDFSRVAAPALQNVFR